jgi:hypothetical protein
MVGPFELQPPAALVVAAAQLVLLEFTSMLLVGPPMIWTVLLPLSWNACGHEGLRTMIGTGAVACRTPQTAPAFTSTVEPPPTNLVRLVGKRDRKSVV